MLDASVPVVTSFTAQDRIPRPQRHHHGWPSAGHAALGRDDQLRMPHQQTRLALRSSAEPERPGGHGGHIRRPSATPTNLCLSSFRVSGPRGRGRYVSRAAAAAGQLVGNRGTSSCAFTLAHDRLPTGEAPQAPRTAWSTRSANRSHSSSGSSATSPTSTCHSRRIRVEHDRLDLLGLEHLAHQELGQVGVTVGAAWLQRAIVAALPGPARAASVPLSCISMASHRRARRCGVRPSNIRRKPPGGCFAVLAERSGASAVPTARTRRGRRHSSRSVAISACSSLPPDRQLGHIRDHSAALTHASGRQRTHPW